MTHDGEFNSIKFKLIKLSVIQSSLIYHPHDFLFNGTGDNLFIVKSEMWFGSIPSECGCFRLMKVFKSCIDTITFKLSRRY